MITNHSLKVFVESLGGKFWVSEPKGVARAYFGGSYRQPYVEFGLDSKGRIDLGKGTLIEAHIRATAQISNKWLACQKRLAIDEYKPQLLAVAALAQLDKLSEGVEVDLSAHVGEWYPVGEGLDVALTDGATIAGVPVGCGGAHLVKDGRLWRPAVIDNEVDYKATPLPEPDEDDSKESPTATSGMKG